MGSKEIGDRVSSLHQGNGSCCPSSSSVMLPAALASDNVADMSICPESIFRPPNGMDPFWDPGQFPNPVMLENQATGTGSSCHFPGLPELLPKIPPNFSDMIVSPYPRSDNFYPNQGGNSLESSPNGKRKRKKDPNGETSDNIAGKQAKDHSNCAAESSYIHVRAKRGQATNSHSLAERVRREKISERMKLLQELVPGCNKITGKAVMLDEIINYVQSLQQQVEFLSMKVASVNPEESKDITECGGGRGVRCWHPFPGLPPLETPLQQLEMPRAAVALESHKKTKMETTRKLLSTLPEAK